MATTSDVKKVIIDTLACKKTKLSNSNRKALKQLLEDLDDNESKKIKKEITNREWYKVLKDITSAFGQIILSFVKCHYESG